MVKRILSFLKVLVLLPAFTSASFAQKDDKMDDIGQLIEQMQQYSEKANSAYNLGNYVDAANYSGRALEMHGKYLGQNSEAYVNSAIIHASYAVLAGDSKKAVSVGKKALDIQRSLPGQSRLDYARTASILSDIFVQAEACREAVALAGEVCEIYRKTYGDNSPSMIPPLRILAKANYRMANFKEAIRYAEKMVSIQKEQQAPAEDLVHSLLSLFDFYVADKRHAESVSTMDDIRELVGRVHSATLQLEMSERIPSLLKMQGKQATEIIRADEDVIRQSMAVYGKNSRKTLNAIESLLYDCYEQNQYAKAHSYCALYVDLVKKQISENIIAASLSRQAAYWEQYAFSLSTFVPFLAYAAASVPSLSGVAYDALLLGKSYLLQSENHMRHAVQSSGDSVLKEAYNEMLQGLSDLNVVRELPYKDRPVEESVIEDFIEERQRFLYARLGSGFHASTWKDIQKELKPGEAAIELAVVQDYRQSYRFDYVAYVIKSGNMLPVQVPLFDLIAWHDGCDSRKPDLRMYNLVWKPLENVLKDVSRVYFSPAGNLWESPFEHCVSENANMPLSHLEVYRVTSTAEILKSRSKNRNAFVLFGGMNYRVTDDEVVASMKRSRKRGSLDDISLSTLQEVSEIAKILEQHQQEGILYTGKDASEDVFRRQSGTCPRAIHIATHGFCWGSPVSKQGKDTRVARERSVFGANDNSLHQCGLLFSGAKNSGQGLESPFEADGFLTGAEIAAFDLLGTELVVLSACQTGLGTVSVEGVWGLSRAFKRAGVHSILTTLWSVDDDATYLFMIAFYKHWLNGNSKIDSLKKAQQYLREYEVDGLKVYSDPEYWAGFTLLDAVN